MAAVVMAPSFGLTSALAQPDSLPSAAQADAKQSLADHVARAQRGLPPAPSPSDCATAKRVAGPSSCIRPSTPAENDPGAVAAIRADLADRASKSSPDGSATSPDGSATANIAVPIPSVPPLYCPVDGFHYEGRKGACQIYNFVHEVRYNGRTIAEAHFTITEWSALSHTSRSWDHYAAIRQNWGTNVAGSGMYIYMTPRCFPVTACTQPAPTGTFQWIPLHVTYHVRTVQTSNQHPVDYSNQNTNVYTMSALGGIWATGSTQLFDRIRCDFTAYVNNSQGCVWSNMPGYFRLSLTGEAADSARWIAEAQQKLVTHPGLLGRGYGLHRADDRESAANRAVSGPVCALRGTEEGKQCDEYPFAAVVEGAGAPFAAQGVTWDVDMVVSEHNRMAGVFLSVFYSQERMWWGDHFYVVITP